MIEIYLIILFLLNLDTDENNECDCPDPCQRTAFGYDTSYTSFSELSLDALLTQVEGARDSHRDAVNTAHR